MGETLHREPPPSAVIARAGNRSVIDGQMYGRGWPCYGRFGIVLDDVYVRGSTDSMDAAIEIIGQEKEETEELAEKTRTEQFAEEIEEHGRSLAAFGLTLVADWIQDIAVKVQEAADEVAHGDLEEEEVED